MEYNNGSVIDFEIIKQNREKAVKEIAEGNVGLEELLNFCIDNNIRTHSSCGDRSPRICFIVDDENREKLVNLFSVLDSLECDGKKIFNIQLFKNPYFDEILLNIFISCDVKSSEIYFKYIVQILDSKVRFSKNDKFDFIENVIDTLKNYFDYVSFDFRGNQKRVDFNLKTSSIEECKYGINLYLSRMKRENTELIDCIYDNVDYCFKCYDIYEFGIKNMNSVYKLFNIIKDLNTKNSFIKKIKSLF